MTDQELRALVKDAVARHLGRRPGAASPQPGPGPTPVGHPSQAIYVALVNQTEACIIEPSVPCEHCGYCKTHGH